ncbi:MAG: carotenoid biosynthesis protein [Gemmatimonadales bacterium]|nr:MAG: carotenoid biosynthesis protein [Gemmatimonadales bacterium]
MDGIRVNTARTGGIRSPEGIGLIAFLVFTFIALAGYGIFGLRPWNLPMHIDLVVSFWEISNQFFAQLHIILGSVVLGILLVRYAGWKWFPAFVLVYVFSFLSEYFGTGYGIPFGHYTYTELLGWKIDDRVPWVIPLSWFLMAVPSYALARVTFPGRAGRWPRILFAAVLLTLWDLALDPAMSYQAPFTGPLYWVWDDTTAPYYGMPWVNLAGWVGTGIVLMICLEFTGADNWTDSLSLPWLSAYYGITVLMPFGMIILEGLWVAVITTIVAYILAYGLHVWVARRRSSPAHELEDRPVQEVA